MAGWIAMYIVVISALKNGWKSELHTCLKKCEEKGEQYLNLKKMDKKIRN